MIYITPTPNYAGVNITGDFYAFDQLYESLHRILGNENEKQADYQARLHVLGLCCSILTRHRSIWAGHRSIPNRHCSILTRHCSIPRWEHRFVSK